MGIFQMMAHRTSARRTRALMRRAEAALACAADFESLSDDELIERAAGDLDEAHTLAIVREAVRRETDLVLTAEQLACACALIDGDIAEASTGSGKTLAALPAAFALSRATGSCHVITVNEYLARRDAEQASCVLGRVGLSVGVTVAGDTPVMKREAYACDVTYTTPSEVGFDYLRDNMARRREDQVLRSRTAAIIDEADSILIDEARTPLIISGARPQSVDEAVLVASAVRDLREDTHLSIDRAKRTVTLTEEGEGVVEARLPWRVRSTPARANLVRQALVAEYIYRRDVDYIVRAGKVEIVDEQTGRVMEGRRWSNGLHAAVEAKEGVEIEPETATMASITIQNLFRGYDHISGMTGTAMSEDAEFERVFGVSVSVIPDHVPSAREDLPDLFFADDASRLSALVADVCRRHEAAQPVLIGTQSVEDSDMVASALRDKGLEVSVLNARDNEAEAAIVARAGMAGRITVSTNMAGRGTDIRLGGTPSWEARALAGRPLSELGDDERAELMDRAEALCRADRERVVSSGGLAVVSCGRNQSRRIDDQLRGRSGRQGDVGSSQFFVSLDDDLLRLFNADAVERARASIKSLDGEPLRSRAVANLVEGAQERLAERDAEVRRGVLDYDDVTLAAANRVRAMRERFLDADEKDVDAVRAMAASAWDAVVSDKRDKAFIERSGLREDDDVMAAFDARVKSIGEAAPAVLCACALTVIDRSWSDHLVDVDMLREGIGLVGIAGTDPLVEFKRVSSELCDQMMHDIDEGVLSMVLTMQVVHGVPNPKIERDVRRPRRAMAADEALAEIAPMSATGEEPHMNRAQRRAAKKSKRSSK